ncbi:unnamed protein product [Natator depressus]
MRRAGLGEGAPTGNYGYTNSGYSVHEEENERLTESLRTKVSAIKSLSIEIGTEVKNQNKMLSDMGQKGGTVLTKVDRRVLCDRFRGSLLDLLNQPLLHRSQHHRSPMTLTLILRVDF